MKIFWPISLALGLTAALAACNNAPQSSSGSQPDSISDSSNLQAQAINKLIKASGPKSWDNIVQEGTAVANARYTASFRIAMAEPASIRLQDGNPIPGFVYVLIKS